jgi:hypothetical protein
MSANSELDDKILKIMESYRPDTVENLVEQAQRELNLSEENIIKHVLKLEKNGKLLFSDQNISTPISIIKYLFSIHSIKFWVICVFSILTTISVFIIDEKAYPYIFIRYVLGTIFILILPGYSLLNALFQTIEINVMEILTLSLAISLALVPFIGLILNYTIWRLKNPSIVLSILILIVFLNVISLIREHDQKISDIPGHGVEDI